MKPNRMVACIASLSMVLTPLAVSAQEVTISRSVLPDLPYTLVYPAAMQASGGGADPITLNHPDAPLQCDLTIVAVEDTDWSPETALSELDDAQIADTWTQMLPGFALESKGVAQYQNTSALTYEGTSTDSEMGIPLTLVHTETVANGRGYALDCLYAADQGEQARPIVDFIVTNFSTRADANCCVGLEPAVEPDAPAAQ